VTREMQDLIWVTRSSKRSSVEDPLAQYLRCLCFRERLIWKCVLDVEAVKFLKTLSLALRAVHRVVTNEPDIQRLWVEEGGLRECGCR
jgi:hypothetical protein